MSDHPDIWRSDGCRTLNGCDELRVSATRTVCVVVELSARSVVDDAIVCIVSAARPRAGKESRIAGREVAVGSEPRESRVIEAQAVPIAVEVEQRIGVTGAEL